MTEEAKNFLQGEVNTIGRNFVRAVARGRNVAESTVTAQFGKGRVLFAPAAQRVGMIDGVETLNQALAGASSTRSARAATVTATARPSSLSQYEARHRRLEDLKHGDSGGRTPRGNLVNVLARKGKAYEDPAIDARDEAYWRRRIAEERHT